MVVFVIVVAVLIALCFFALGTIFAEIRNDLNKKVPPPLQETWQAIEPNPDKYLHFRFVDHYPFPNDDGGKHRLLVFLCSVSRDDPRLDSFLDLISGDYERIVTLDCSDYGGFNSVDCIASMSFGFDILQVTEVTRFRD